MSREVTAGEYTDSMSSEVIDALINVRDCAKDPYAQEYLTGLGRSYKEYGMRGVKVQIQHVIGNLASWRGEVARESKKILRKYVKEKNDV